MYRKNGDIQASLPKVTAVATLTAKYIASIILYLMIELNFIVFTKLFSSNISIVNTNKTTYN